ncbi:MAG: DNA polymerase III subunit gamma/tau [Deltaproteobacteria bacterium]|nr:DNA polymerase III subunit gamma/tau [Deltaproteobacteria bacterium]MDL1960760.1 DNA polymerase III subunit gamma/tau [Deltaproteobacteria bacterium]
MSYLVLARKWRPQTFGEVVGQTHVTKTLQNALKNDCLAHALLFSGPRGVGKTSVARILAKAANCESGPAPDPCNKCGVCREITAGSSIDVQEIDGASNRGIDEIRELRENILFRPTRCRHRIYIIDEVHMLTGPAFNALLKTLEEPPSHVYFIFATTEPQKIPATIHSRCQHYEFRRLGTAELADHLGKIVQAEGMGLQQDAMLLLAREAEGSVRDSLSLLDQVAAYGATSLKEVCEVLGVMGTQVLKELAIAILEGDVAKALRLIDEVYNFGGNIQKFATDLVVFFRHLVVLRNLGPEKAVTLMDLSRENVDEFFPVISKYSAHSLFQVLDALIKGQEAIYRSTTPRLSLEILVIRLCSMKEVVGLDDLLEKVDKLLSSAPIGKENFSKEPLKEISAASENDSVTQTTKECDPEIWTDFVDFVKEQSSFLGSLLVCCKGIETESNGNRIQLKCRPGMQYDMLCEVDHQQRLRELAKKFFGRAIDLEVEGVCVADNGDARRTGKTCNLRDELIQSSLVQEAVKVFHARISDVRIFSNKG